MKKIIFTLVLVISSTIIFAQTMVVKKSDGTYQEIAITTAVELSFYSPCVGTPTVTDSRDSKVYNTVQIGSQCWLKENLNVGNMITGAIAQTNNSPSNTIEKYCYNNNEDSCTKYGGLYQWAEAVQYQNGASNTALLSSPFVGNVQGICPTGWHIPTYGEQQTLATAVSSNGNSLKAIGQGSGTNTSGFSALLAGFRNGSGFFGSLGYYTGFWSSTEYDATSAYFLSLGTVGSGIGLGSDYKGLGFSIRCLKD